MSTAFAPAKRKTPARTPLGEQVVRRHPQLGVIHVYRRPKGNAQREYEEEIVVPDDTRGPVMKTLPVPYRFVCWLDLDFFNAATGEQIVARGTGTLIGPRHVLTAGHNLVNRFGGVDLAVRSVRVGPGFNCLEKRGDILGIAHSLRTRVTDRWRDFRDREFDFGVITLRTAIGESKPAALGEELGWWGSKTSGGDTRINAVTPPARLRGFHVNISGYPGDKCCMGAIDVTQTCNTSDPLRPCRDNLWATAQYRSFGRITDPAPAVAPRLAFYNLDTCVGHSGSPVWTTWKDEKSGRTYRNLVAIHTGAASTRDPTLAGQANRGVRITDAVLTEVERLKRAP